MEEMMRIINEEDPVRRQVNCVAYTLAKALWFYTSPHIFDCILPYIRF